MTALMPLGSKPFENIVGKGEIAHNKQFLLYPHCFLPVKRTVSYFHQFKIVFCKLFQFGRVSNLLFGKGLSHIANVLHHVVIW